MDCISPPALDDIKLLNHLDGEVNDEVARHIKQCPYCDNNAKRLARLQNGLKARLYRIDCPAPDELGEYHLRLLEHDRVEIVRDHLGKCLLCQRELAQLEEFMYDDKMPNSVISAREYIKVLVARLTDSGLGQGQSSLKPAYTALRGNAQAPITLEADGILVVLDVQPVLEERVTILGQIAADDQDRWTDALVELRYADSEQLMTTVDDLGAFRFEEVLPGLVELLITPPNGSAVLVPNIEIAA